MEEYIKLFQNHTQYEAYKNSADYIRPNVSYCEDNKDVHYNPWEETRVVAKYNVTSTSSTINILNSSSVSYFTEIEIDGVVQPSVVYSYKFDTLGEHTVKYTLADPTRIDSMAFYNTGLVSVIIPDGVTNINTQAFSFCRSLTSVTIPNSVTSISGSVFSNCTNLTSVTIPDSVTSIGSSAFYYCSGLTSVVIPNSVTSINYGVFDSCRSLTSVTIPDSVISIGNNAFRYCSSLTSVNIPNNVTSIGDNAFGYCSGLTSVTIGSGVTSIGASAFTYCSGLTSVTIPNSVTSIGGQAFFSCSTLTSVIIGNDVTSIGSGAFRYCGSLTSITSLATTAPTIQSSTFRDIKINGTLTVLTGSTGYDVWMGTGNYYLGQYNWTKIEQ